MKISIIVPTFGRNILLTEALNSIAGQSYPNFECIVVDDFSPDPVELPVLDDRFRVVRRSTNGGPAAARNSGLEVATGDAIAFLDDDDLFAPRRLEVAASILSKREVAFCAGGTINSDLTKVHRFDGSAYHSIANSTTPNLGCVAIRAGVCPQFDTNYAACEDVDWLLRAVRDASVGSSAEIGWIWRRHDGPRVLHGDRARLAGSLRLLEQHSEYFSSHRAARGFRQYRVATLLLRAGDYEQAKAWALRALRSGEIRAAKALLRAYSKDKLNQD